ncbi:ThiF family adenylyltransferase [Desulfitobacterium hafniense]|uniref:Thiamine biosynthesis protein ThiF n=2 Tax=Desulfitobacterium hafniense TaxID=49338 RepID=A0A0W1JBY7_DESHA|nr:ThiF family adenylyltransferase [Desulfitobacterium hafniense]EHL05444.1 ThiF family protein [Desulfitobacterium hafniense DP7]KTE89085.1 thiamine biosynthesis protein ThiF [Desulfitobacterium hafniense]
MEVKQTLDKLKQARRALDSLSQVEVIDDWKFDDDLKIWFLHLGISIGYETSYFPQVSQWYIVAESEYPKGKVKVYPDVKNSIKVTLYHQSNNSKVEKNGLWRKGELCLEVNTISDFHSEPYGVDERLLYHVKRAVNWLELAAKDKLALDNEPFELPEFTLSNVLEVQFAFSEDVVTFMQWESTECRYGIAELDVYKKSKPFVYYVKTFKSMNGNVKHYTQWGNHLSKTIISPPIKAPWILLNRIPVIDEWQAPETFGDLIDACNGQNIDIMGILKNVVSEIRDGKRHLFLLGFPIPKVFGGELEIIFWKALYLPVVSYGIKTVKGFRTNQQGWWLRDKNEVFTRKTKLDWLVSENWNQHEISQRGRMNDLLLRKKVLLVGAGCIGAAIAEMLVRAGVYNLTILDSDIFEIGNLSRHTLNLNHIGELKELSLCNYLNSLNPHANIEVISDKLTNNENFEVNIDMDKYPIIIDCTGENRVLDIFQNADFKKNHVLASVSVGLGAKHLYITLMSGNTFNFDIFYELIFPYVQSEKDLFGEYNLPRNGIGCWHPTFPARSDDVWLAAAISVKVIENYIVTKSEKTLSLVYEQKESDGIFEGYVVVDKREDG